MLDKKMDHKIMLYPDDLELEAIRTKTSIMKELV